MTDGCVYVRKNRPNSLVVTLTSKDKDWLETINQYICPNKPLLKHGLNCYRLMYMSSDMGNWLISHGCGARKSLILQFPDIPIKYLGDFIRGCWDGDGSLSHTKSANKGRNWQRQANLTSGSKEFCQSMSDHLTSLEVKNKITPHGNHERKIDGRVLQPSMSWRVVVSNGNSTYNLCKSIYEDCIISMPRKQKIAESIIAEWESE